jgi:hypothetical protein
VQGVPTCRAAYTRSMSAIVCTLTCGQHTMCLQLTSSACAHAGDALRLEGCSLNTKERVCFKEVMCTQSTAII